MSRVKGKAMAFVMAFCLLFTGVFGQNGTSVSAQESSILTESVITLNNQELTESTKVKNGDVLKLNFQWALQNEDKTQEYVIDLDLRGIRIQNGETPQDIVKNEVVGQYWITSDGKLHIKFDPSKDFFTDSNRIGGIKLDGIVNVDESTVEDHEPVEIGWAQEPYKVIFSYGDPKSWLEARKELAGAVTEDASGNLWQEFKVTLTAHDNHVKNINITDIAGSGLTNATAVWVAGSVSGGDALQTSYADMAALNAALSGAVLEKDQSLVLTYRMQVDKDIYAQNAGTGDYENYVSVKYETNEKTIESKDSNKVNVEVNKPTITKSGVANAEQDKITWTIRITLGDYSAEGFDGAVSSVLEQAGVGLTGAGGSVDIKSLFREDTANPGTYVAIYTTDVVYEGLNNAKNTVQMTVDNHVYTAEAAVPLTPPQWISKSCRGMQGGYLVWDVYLSPKDYVTDVTLSDALDGGNFNKQVFANGVWIDDKEILTFEKELWKDCWNGTYTSEADGIIEGYHAGMKQYNPIELEFTDAYIKSKVDSNAAVKITYKTKITDKNAADFLNSATVSYYDPAIQENTSQTVAAAWTDNGSTVEMNKQGWAQNDNKSVKYEIVVDFSKYKYLDDGDLVDDKFEVTDLLPPGLRLGTAGDAITVKAGDNYNQYVQVPFTSSTITIEGEQRQQVTLALTMSQQVIDDLKRVRDNTTFKPIIKITLWTDIEDVAGLVRDGSQTFENYVQAEFDGISMEDTHSLTVTAPAEVTKTGKYNQTTGINDYTIEINKDALDLSTAGDVLTGIDTLGRLDNYIYDTMKVERVEGNTHTELVKGTDYRYTYSAEEHRLTLEGLPDKTHLIITYQTRLQLIDGSMAEGDFTDADVRNTFELYGFTTDATKSSVTTITSVSKANLSGWAGSDVGTITIQKFWSNGGQMVALNGVTFDLYKAVYDAASGQMKLTDKVKEDIAITQVQGTVTISKLPLKTIYALVETKAPYGFGTNEPYYFVLRNENDPEIQAVLASIPSGVVKEFVDGAVVLYENEKANGTLELQKSLEGITLSDADESRISFTISPRVGSKDTYDLSSFTESNGIYTLSFANVPVGEYTVVETRTDIIGCVFQEMTYGVSTGGIQQSTGSEKAGVTGTRIAAPVEENKTTTVAVTNAYEEYISISGSKTWNDDNNRSGNRPESITINLLADGVKKESKVITEADGWRWSFGKLPKYAAGKEIVYTITEEKVLAYDQEINGYDITNTYVKNTGRLIISKTIEGDAARAEAEAVLQFTVTDSNNKVTSYTLKDFVYDAAKGRYTLSLEVDFKGISGIYTIEEAAYDMDGYQAGVTYSVDGGAAVAGNKATVVMERDKDSSVSFVNIYEKEVIPTPTPKPTAVPTWAPEATPVPTAVPSAAPTRAPEATPAPTRAPEATPVPTAVPSAAPTQAPAKPPTVAATPVPTQAPTQTPIPELDVSVPKTGDEAPIGLWLTLMLSSLAGMIMVFVCIVKRKKNEEE